MLAVSNNNRFLEDFERELLSDDFERELLSDDFPMRIMMEMTTQEQEQPTTLMEEFDFFDYPLHQEQDVDGGLGLSPPLSTGAGLGDDHQKVSKKRKNHNESERERRKKINDLYSSLRALLPASDNKKRLSIPATIARTLKYIPELQKEVEDLTQKKEGLLSKAKALERDDEHSKEERPIRKKPRIAKTEKNKSSTKMCSVSIDNVSDKEIVIHISTSERVKSLPDLLLLLEKVGFLVMDVSSFQSSGGRNLYHIHLAMGGTTLIKYEILKEKLSMLVEKHSQAVHQLANKQKGKGISC